jgi:hypothetical protein
MKPLEDAQLDGDAALKAALNHAFGHDAAPRALRDRVTLAMAMATSTADAPEASRPARSRWDLKRLLTQPITPGLAAAAVAAVILLTSGLWYTVDTLQSRGPRTGPAGIVLATPQPFPSTLAQELAARHDASLRGEASAQQISAGADALPGDLKARLVEKLGRTPWVADLRNKGWSLAGAQVAEVDHVPAGQIVYRKGDASLSVITMAAPASCEGIAFGQYQSKLGPHAIAGFTCGGTLYCMVARSDRPTGAALTDVTALRDEFQSEILADARGCAATAPAAH